MSEDADAPALYHAGQRALQDAFDSRRLADRLAERLSRTAFTDDDRAFIERQGLSEHAPREGHMPPEPAWKSFEMIRDVLPRRDG